MPRRKTSPSPSEGSPSAPDSHLRHGAGAWRCPLHPARPGPEGPIAQLGSWEEHVGKGGARLCPGEGGTVPKDPDRQGQGHRREAAPQPLCPGPQRRTRKATKAPWGPVTLPPTRVGTRLWDPGGPRADGGRWGWAQPAHLGHSCPTISVTGSLATHTYAHVCSE